MKVGRLHDANFDRELIEEKDLCKEKCYEYNMLRPSQKTERANLINRLLGKVGYNVIIEQPFHCDYGYNIETGVMYI